MELLSKSIKQNSTQKEDHIELNKAKTFASVSTK